MPVSDPGNPEIVIRNNLTEIVNYGQIIVDAKQL